MCALISQPLHATSSVKSAEVEGWRFGLHRRSGQMVETRREVARPATGRGGATPTDRPRPSVGPSRRPPLRPGGGEPAADGRGRGSVPRTPAGCRNPAKAGSGADDPRGSLGRIPDHSMSHHVAVEAGLREVQTRFSRPGNVPSEKGTGGDERPDAGMPARVLPGTAQLAGTPGMEIGPL